MNKSCCPPKNKHDLLLIATSVIIIAAYLAHIGIDIEGDAFATFTLSTFEIVNEMWWGMLLGIFFVGALSGIPRELIMSILGKGGTFTGLLRATAAGVLLDLCSHGILLVGMKLYERGASLGQVMAFLIASPWNSLTLTLVLWGLVGFKWMAAMLLLSLLIAIISGMIFDLLEKRGILPKNPNTLPAGTSTSVKAEFKKYFQSLHPTPYSLPRTLLKGLSDSKMILRWLFLGMVFAALIRTFVNPDVFETFFGPTLGGLGLTLIAATIIEVCSEGSVPIAADLLVRAKAGGNAFAFLMTGVATDYTEILSLKETTKSWKISLFLPLITVPQVIIIAMVLNRMLI